MFPPYLLVAAVAGGAIVWAWFRCRLNPVKPGGAIPGNVSHALALNETLAAFARFFLILLGLLGLAALGHYGWGPFTVGGAVFRRIRRIFNALF